MRNNPIRYSDPTGHRVDDGCLETGCTFPDGLDYNSTYTLVDEGEAFYFGNLDLLNSASTLLFQLRRNGIDISINQTYRSPQDAHAISTAVGIFNGNISLHDLIETPIDEDGNTWYSPVWEEECAFSLDPSKCLQNKILDNAINNVPVNYHTCEGISFFGICIGSSGLPPRADEGYSFGDSRQLPNSNRNISTHLNALAVDLLYSVDDFDSIVFSEAINLGLCRPIENEPWHFTFCK